MLHLSGQIRHRRVGADGNHEGDPAYQAHTSLMDSKEKYLYSREVDFITFLAAFRGQA